VALCVLRSATRHPRPAAGACEGIPSLTALPLTEVPAARSRVALRRALGLVFGFAISIGLTIGAGILRAPADVAARLPDARLFFAAWIAGGIYALLGANALSELAAMLPQSGGQYVYAQRAFGPFAGFVVGWSDWSSTCGTIAAVSFVLAGSAAFLIPPLAGHTTLLALAVITLLTGILWRGVRWSERAQQITSVVKAAALMALIVACAVYQGPQATLPAGVSAPHVLPTITGFVIAMQGIIYTYDGWSAPLYFSEEVHNPGREVPRSILGGLALIAGIYLALNVGFIHIVPLPVMAQSQLPAATAAGQIFGARGNTIVQLIVVLALPSTICACLLAASRVAFGLGRDGLASGGTVRVNPGGTPVAALFVSALMGAAFLLTGTFEAVIAMLSFFFVANYTLSFAAVFVLRHREPNLPRPYRTKGYPWTTGLALIGSIAFLAGAVISDPKHSLYCLVLLSLSYPVFLWLRSVERRGG
jgi:basic amino acid/polyamine antiporter, APA family